MENDKQSSGAEMISPCHLGTAFVVLALVLSLLFIPLLFLYNDDIDVMRAAYVDSGSIMESILTMLSIENFYNQHAGFHSSTYGWTPNSILFLQFVLLKYVFGLAPQQYFTLYAILARANNFIFSLATLAAFFLFVQRLIGNRGRALLLTILAACFSPFMTYCYQIHPEPSAMFFVLVSFHFLLSFLQNPCRRSLFFAAVFFASLGMMAKPPFGMALVSVGLGYLWARYHTWRSDLHTLWVDTLPILISAGIVLGTVFVIHPYHFFEFERSQRAVDWLYQYHHASVSIGTFTNAGVWLRTIILRDYVVLIGCISVLAGLFAFRRGRTAQEKMGWLMAFYTVGYMAWIMWFLRRPINFNYVYPVYFFFLLVSVFILQRLSIQQNITELRRKTLRILTAGIMIAFVVQSVCQCLDGACVVANQLAIKHRNPFVARKFLLELGPRPWRVIYFPSIPIPDGYYPWTRNICCYPNVGEDLDRVMKKVAPDAIFLDYAFWDASRIDEFVRVADTLGLSKRWAMPGGVTKAEQKGCSTPFDIPASLHVIWQNMRCWAEQENGPPSESTISIFTKP
jgi:hypothetical protein